MELVKWAGLAPTTLPCPSNCKDAASQQGAEAAEAMDVPCKPSQQQPTELPWALTAGAQLELLLPLLCAVERESYKTLSACILSWRVLIWHQRA